MTKPALRRGTHVRYLCFLCAKKLLNGHHKSLLSLEHLPHPVSWGHEWPWTLSPLEFSCLVEGKDNVLILQVVDAQ